LVTINEKYLGGNLISFGSFCAVMCSTGALETHQQFSNSAKGFFVEQKQENYRRYTGFCPTLPPLSRPVHFNARTSIYPKSYYGLVFVIFHRYARVNASTFFCLYIARHTYVLYIQTHTRNWPGWMFCACLCVFFSLKIHTPSTFAFHVSRRFDFNFEISSELKLKVYLSSVTVNPEEKKNQSR